ncbi:MAG: ribonuclease P protein component 1 [Candidatus Hydrothermarchaeales archaeon]
MITPRNLVRHELIGLDVEVADSTDPTLKGIKGRIIDETRNMLAIEASGKRKRVPKGICKFRFRVKDVLVEVDGRVIVGRPQDRIKK